MSPLERTEFGCIDRSEAVEQFRVQERARLKAWIEDKVWDAADSIGHGYDRLDKYSPEELVAYARAQRNLLESLAEREEIDNLVNLFLQFEAAVGERLHRAGLGKLKRRLFNNLIEQVRAKRIAMLDRYELLDYRTEYQPWRNRIWALERKGVEREDWDEFNQVRHELDALSTLSHHLIADRSWFAKHYELRKAQANQATPEAA